MYCFNCGNQIDDKAVICVKCGVATKNYQSSAFRQEAPVGRFDWLTTLLLCFFLGCFGAHRFYTQKTGTAILQLLTLGGLGIWCFIDFIIIIVGGFRDGEGNLLQRR